MQKVIITAVFKGKNKSCGFLTHYEYTLIVSQKKDYILIESVEGGNVCKYESVMSFLRNWDKLVHTKK